MLTLEADASKPLPAVKPDFDDFYEQANIVKIWGRLSQQSVLEAITALDQAATSDKLLVSLSSSGGNFAWALELADFMQRLQNNGVEIRIIVERRCMSAALAPLMVVPLAHRYCTSYARFLLHSVRYRDTSGLVTDLYENEIQSIQEGNLIQHQYLAAGTRIGNHCLDRLMRTFDDVSIAAKEALYLGLVSEIID